MAGCRGPALFPVSAAAAVRSLGDWFRCGRGSVLDTGSRCGRNKRVPCTNSAGSGADPWLAAAGFTLCAALALSDPGGGLNFALDILTSLSTHVCSQPVFGGRQCALRASMGQPAAPLAMLSLIALVHALMVVARALPPLEQKLAICPHVCPPFFYTNKARRAHGHQSFQLSVVRG